MRSLALRDVVEGGLEVVLTSGAEVTVSSDPKLACTLGYVAVSEGF